MDAVRAIKTFARHECRFVVVGSAARMLLGEPVTPQDVDLVVDPAPLCRMAILGALAELGARVERRRVWAPIASTRALPWEWGWKTRTVLGSIDVITHFLDGTDFEHHNGLAVDVVTAAGSRVRCSPTRHAA